MISNIKIEVLKVLREQLEFVFTYKGLQAAMPVKIDRKTLHRHVIRLLHQGYIEHTQAYDEQNDYFSGSGFNLNYKKLHEVDKIIAEYEIQKENATQANKKRAQQLALAR